jgi:hypothetical protein
MRIHLLLQLKIEKQAGDTALLSMTKNVAARLDVKSRKSRSSRGIFVSSVNFFGFATQTTSLKLYSAR